MKILIACEYSGKVREAFRAKGHDAISCDLIASDDNSPHHIIGDVRDVIESQEFDLMIAHPPCTYLCNSGVSWLSKDESRCAKLDEGAEFFSYLLNCNIPKIAIENPIPHKYAVQRIGRKYDQIIQPFQFGHAERKATCFWLKSLPKLQPTSNLKAEMESRPKSLAQRLHHLPPSKDRWKLRSETFQGIANAIADQWGDDQNA
jgi:hypothetical protein